RGLFLPRPTRPGVPVGLSSRSLRSPEPAHPLQSPFRALPPFASLPDLTAGAPREHPMQSIASRAAPRATTQFPPVEEPSNAPLALRSPRLALAAPAAGAARPRGRRHPALAGPLRP